MEFTAEEFAEFDKVLSEGTTQDIRDQIAKHGKAKCDAMFRAAKTKELLAKI